MHVCFVIIGGYWARRKGESGGRRILLGLASAARLAGGLLPLYEFAIFVPIPHMLLGDPAQGPTIVTLAVAVAAREAATELPYRAAALILAFSAPLWLVVARHIAHIDASS